MTARLVPIVRNFAISYDVFTVGSPDVRGGCITPGEHRLLRFDVLCHNAGDTDIVLGEPSSRPDLFAFSQDDRRYYLPDFVHVVLEDAAGTQVSVGHKRVCLIDVERIDAWGRDTPQFTDCNVNQGISAGWADLYRASLKCQYVVIDGVPDGTYTLRVSIDAQRILPGDAGDSSLMVQLRLAGDTVTAVGGGSVVAPSPAWTPAPLVAPSPVWTPAPLVAPSPAWTPASVVAPHGLLEDFAHEVIDAGDLSAAQRYLAPSFLGHGVSLLDPGADPIDLTTYTALLRELSAAFDGVRTTFDTSFAENDWVAASWTRRGVHVGPYGGLPPSRRSIEINGVSIARLEHGRIAEQWDVVDLGWWIAMGGVQISALEPWA